MSDENLIGDPPRAELETVLRGLALKPAEKTHDRLMYECGRASALAQSERRTRSTWKRVASLAVAVSVGGLIGRWTAGDVPSANENISVAIQDKPHHLTKRGSDHDGASSLWMIRKQKPSELSMTHAAMSLVMLEASLNDRLPESLPTGGKLIGDAGEVWSAGPFLNPLDQIEI